jgi:hypothetical protein
MSAFLDQPAAMMATQMRALARRLPWRAVEEAN